MKPHITCQMLCSVDGRIDGEALETVTAEGEYEATAAQLGGDAWICGRTTMQRHFAEDEPFVSASNTPPDRSRSSSPAGRTPAPSRWTRAASCAGAKGSLSDDHLICVLSKQGPADYLDLLREKDVSYVVCGESSVDLAQAMALLGEHLGIRTLWNASEARLIEQQ